MAFSGIIPTIKVTSNSAVNSAVNGVINNAAQGAVSVALNQTLGQQAASALGFASGSQNFVGNLVNPLINAAPQALNQAITSSILNSNALGPAGPLVSGLASNLTGQLTNSLSGGLGNVGALGAFAEGQGATRYFPGAGDEEDADYGGYNYTPGPVGPDVVFSIKPAQNAASADVLAQMYGGNSGVSAALPWGQIPDVGAGNFLSPQTQGGVLGQSLDTLSSGQGLYSPSPTSGFDLTFPQTPALSGQTFQTGSLDSSTGALFVNPPVQNLPGYSAFSPIAVSLSSPFPEVGTQDYFNIAAKAATSFTDSNLASKYGFGLGSTSQSRTVYGAGDGWKFTTAPGDITWESSAKVERVPIFGTNKPPVVSGSRSMRDLSLSNALIEGFSMVKSVESKIAKLEALLNYTLTSSYVKVPVFWVTASDKKYGNGNNDGGFFVMKQLKVKEEMRDLTGRATRAIVDVSFSQVPDYQVDDGRDLASKSVAGGRSVLSSVSETIDKAAKEAAAKGQLAVIQQDSLGGGGSLSGTAGARGAGNPKGPKPGQVEISPGVFRPKFKDKTNPNGTITTLEFDVPTRQYLPKGEIDKLQAARQKAAGSTP